MEIVSSYPLGARSITAPWPLTDDLKKLNYAHHKTPNGRGQVDMEEQWPFPRAVCLKQPKPVQTTPIIEDQLEPVS